MKPRRILIVDDAPDVHTTAGMALELAGFEVHHANDGRSGLAAMMTGEPPDLVLLDVQMPIMDGFEVLKAMRVEPRLRTLPVLVLSSLDRANLKVRAFQAGADDYIVKPFHPAELVARVTRAIDRTAGAATDGLRGTFDHVPFEDLLQVLETGGKDATVRFPDLDATLVIRNGQLVDAQWKAFEGTEAFVRILLLARGSFQVQHGDEPPEGSHTEPLGRIRDLLMDWTVKLDELARLVPGLRNPSRHAVRTQSRTLQALLAGAGARLPLPLPELAAVLPGPFEENVGLLAHELEAGLLEIHTHDEE